MDGLSAAGAGAQSVGHAPLAGASPSGAPGTSVAGASLAGAPRARDARRPPRAPHLLWAMIAAGVLIGALVAFATAGLPFDVHSWQVLRASLRVSPLHVYALANAHGLFHWPYPSGFMPLMLIAGWVADAVGGFTHVVRLWGVAANGALAWLVWRGLRDRVGERTRLAAAALIALGPVFVVVAGYSAQIDGVAILPAVAAMLVWEREEHRATIRRAVIAGLLIGVGAAIKTVPLVMVLALAPSARSRRELATLVGCAVAVPLLAMAPFLAADWSATTHIVHYQGSPGMGGLSLALQPDVAQRWLTRLVPFNGVERWLMLEHAGAWNALTVAAFALYAWVRRPAPRVAAAVLWLVVLAFDSGFFFQYLVWGMPFFLLAGYVRATALLELVIAVPMLIFYVPAGHRPSLVYVYVPLMLLCWAGWVAGAFWLASRGGTRA